MVFRHFPFAFGTLNDLGVGFLDSVFNGIFYLLGSTFDIGDNLLYEVGFLHPAECIAFDCGSPLLLVGSHYAAVLKRTDWLDTMRCLQVAYHIALFVESTQCWGFAVLVEVKFP